MLMTFSEWRTWFKELPNVVKWFVIIVLLRPLFDNFYYLKEVSVFISPNYIIGVLTPVLAFYSIQRLKKPNYSRLDTYMYIFSAVTGLACGALLLSDAFSFDSIEFSLKLGFTCYMYFFSRRLIRSKEDLHGVMQTFMYSSLIVVVVFSYELIFNPINIQISRGLERFQGNYADVMNYAIYMTISLLILCYTFLRKDIPVSNTKKTILLAFAAVFSVLILFNIHHTASYGVVLAIIILFLIYNFRRNAVIGLAVFFSIVSIIYFIGSETIDEKVMPLIETDIKVYEGEKDNQVLLHGRVGRWMSFIDYFMQQNSIAQFFGLPLGFDNPYMYISKGSHNDYVRTLMSVGYIGLLMYILIIINIVFRILRYKVEFQFLGLTSVSILVLYSISTTPLLYPPLMYILLPVFSMLALPRQVMDSPNEK